MLSQNTMVISTENDANINDFCHFMNNYTRPFNWQQNFPLPDDSQMTHFGDTHIISMYPLSREDDGLSCEEFTKFCQDLATSCKTQGIDIAFNLDYFPDEDEYDKYFPEKDQCEEDGVKKSDFSWFRIQYDSREDDSLKVERFLNNRVRAAGSIIDVPEPQEYSKEQMLKKENIPYVIQHMYDDADSKIPKWLIENDENLQDHFYDYVEKQAPENFSEVFSKDFLMDVAARDYEAYNACGEEIRKDQDIALNAIADLIWHKENYGGKQVMFDELYQNKEALQKTVGVNYDLNENRVNHLNLPVELCNSPEFIDKLKEQYSEFFMQEFNKQVNLVNDLLEKNKALDNKALNTNTIKDTSVGEMNFYEVSIQTPSKSEESLETLRSKLENIVGENNIETISNTKFLINKESVTENDLSNAIKEQEQSKENKFESKDWESIKIKDDFSI